MLATEPPFCGFPNVLVSDSFFAPLPAKTQFYSGDMEICSASSLKYQIVFGGDGVRTEQILTGLTEVFPT